MSDLGRQFHTDPFPHYVEHNCTDMGGTGRFSSLELGWARDEFPAYDDPRWWEGGLPVEKGKRAMTPPAVDGDAAGEFSNVRRTLFGLMSDKFCVEMAELFGLSQVPIPSLEGGGMHVTGPGGRLGMHKDFDTSPNMPHYVRKLNALLYLSHWHPGWGGTLRLGRSTDPSRKAVIPQFGTLVVFDTSDPRSLHGHPDPVTEATPTHAKLRKSLAVYYWIPGEGSRKTTEFTA